MSNISYFNLPSLSQRPALGVRLDGRVVGRIMPVKGGYRYQPKGQYRNPSAWGDLFGSVDACKASVEGPED